MNLQDKTIAVIGLGYVGMTDCYDVRRFVDCYQEF